MVNCSIQDKDILDLIVRSVFLIAYCQSLIMNDIEQYEVEAYEKE